MPKSRVLSVCVWNTKKKQWVPFIAGFGVLCLFFLLKFNNIFINKRKHIKYPIIDKFKRRYCACPLILLQFLATLSLPLPLLLNGWQPKIKLTYGRRRDATQYTIWYFVAVPLASHRFVSRKYFFPALPLPLPKNKSRQCQSKWICSCFGKRFAVCVLNFKARFKPCNKVRLCALQ